MTKMTQAEYAQHKGVSRSAINQAIKANKIPLNKDGLIETEVADVVYSPENNVSGEYLKAKAHREESLARIARVTCLEKEGKVLDTEEVKRAMETLGEMLVRDIDQLQGYSDELVSIAIKDGTKGMRARLKEISREIRRTITDNLTIDAVGDGEHENGVIE